VDVHLRTSTDVYNACIVDEGFRTDHQGEGKENGVVIGVGGGLVTTCTGVLGERRT
jgi:hypothetical protein